MTYTDINRTPGPDDRDAIIADAIDGCRQGQADARRQLDTLQANPAVAKRTGLIPLIEWEIDLDERAAMAWAALGDALR